VDTKLNHKVSKAVGLKESLKPFLWFT